MKRWLQFLLFPLCLAGAAQAADLASWTYDFSTPGDTPGWIKVLPQKTDAVFFGRAEFEIAPADGGSDLLITLFFQEAEGGFLRVFWNAGGCNTILCQNLYEGIGKGLTNQRTLRLPGSWLRSGGVLSFQSSQQDLKLQRVKMDWLTAQTVEVSPDLAGATAVIDSNGKILMADELTGTVAEATADQWKGDVITAQITERVEQIAESVQFVFELEAVPQRARVELELAGLPLNQGLVLWVNGRMAGRISVPVPDLTDAGYQTGEDGSVSYSGWRKGSILIQPELLQAGLNTLQFSQTNDQPAAEILALKDLKLQLKYPATPGPLPPPADETTDTAAVK